MSYTKEEVLKFLRGEASIDGVWFGMKHPSYRGEFWWRSVLLPVLTAEPSSGIPDDMISLTIGQGFVVHGTSEAISYAQSVLLIDSKHPVEAKDNARYFERLAQHRWEQGNALLITLQKARSSMRELLDRLDAL